MRKRIPIAFEDNNADYESLKQKIKQNILKIEPELTGSLLWYSQNAQYVPDSIKIISIEHSHESRYKMTYSFRWNVFNACLDIDACQITTETVNFECHPDALIFDFIDTQQPTAADEL